MRGHGFLRRAARVDIGSPDVGAHHDYSDGLQVGAALRGGTGAPPLCMLDAERGRLGLRTRLDRSDSPGEQRVSGRAALRAGSFLRETGRPALFESGAIVLDLAERSGKLWPADPDAQAQVRSWVIAALNSVEPYLSNVAEVDFFTDDEMLRRLRRPGAVAAAKRRLGKLSAGPRRAPISRGRRVHRGRPNAGLGPPRRGPRSLLAEYPILSAYRERCLGRGRPSGRRSPTSAGTSMPTALKTWGWDSWMFAEYVAT